jgi:transcriptional regulator with XRE-family HTH domain
MTQADVSAKSGVGRNKISELENENLSRLTLPETERCFGALGATLRVTVDWGGAALDRLIDEGHARLVGAMSELLRQLGWAVEFEVTFARFGERGAIDILAWHARTGTLLIVEIKTELGSLERLLRPLNMKVRLAPVIALQQFGWRGVTSTKLLVLPDDRNARRTVARHAAVLDHAFPSRTRQVRRWLAEPSGQLDGLMFLTSAQLVGAMRNPSTVHRVRHPQKSDP